MEPKEKEEAVAAGLGAVDELEPKEKAGAAAGAAAADVLELAPKLKPAPDAGEVVDAGAVLAPKPKLKGLAAAGVPGVPAAGEVFAPPKAS